MSKAGGWEGESSSMLREPQKLAKCVLKAVPPNTNKVFFAASDYVGKADLSKGC